MGENYSYTLLFEYMVPNYSLRDIIEIVDEESPFGLPTIRVLGRKGVRVDIKLETLGHIRGYFSMYTRVMGIIIDGFRYTNLLGRIFKTNHISLVQTKHDHVLITTYTEIPVSREEFIEAIKNDKKLYYLYDDIMNSSLDIEFIHDPKVIEEVKEHYYSRYGEQVRLP